MALSPSADDRVGRMEFLLGLRRHGIMDAGVLRAMGRGAARALRHERPCRHRLCGSGAADRLRADHQQALCGRTYMTERLAVGPEHRVLEVGTGLRLPGRDPVAACPRGDHHRTLPHRWPRPPASASRRSATPMSRSWWGTGLAGASTRRRRSTASSLTAAAEQIPQPLVDQLGEGAASWCSRSDRTTTAQTIVTLTKTEQGLPAREPGSAVRFVPLLPGKAREL